MHNYQSIWNDSGGNVWMDLIRWQCIRMQIHFKRTNWCHLSLGFNHSHFKYHTKMDRLMNIFFSHFFFVKCNKTNPAVIWLTFQKLKQSNKISNSLLFKLKVYFYRSLIYSSMKLSFGLRGRHKNLLKSKREYPAKRH